MGKTAALRSLTGALNPHRYQVLYQADTDFGRVDIYRSLARALGVEPSYRRAQLWRDIKQRVHELVASCLSASSVLCMWHPDHWPALSRRQLGHKHRPSVTRAVLIARIGTIPHLTEGPSHIDHSARRTTIIKREN